MNCDEWFEVDFGRGPVTVRCTQVGPHVDHKCLVIKKAEQAAGQMNVFDRTPDKYVP